MRNHNGDSKQVKMVVGPQYYTRPDGSRVIVASSTITDAVKYISEKGDSSESLTDIIHEQFAMMELNLKKDICNMYCNTYAIHGGSYKLSGNSTDIRVENYRKKMNISNEVNAELPYILL